MSNNPYTHLRTLLDDESRHEEFERSLWSVLTGFPITATHIKCPPYTTSLDALIPLWPEGWPSWILCKDEPSVFFCSADGTEKSFESYIRKTPALAMLDCLLQVLEYEWEEKHVS